MSSAHVNVSLRELRLVTGRLLHAFGMPRGAVVPVREVLVHAEALGLDSMGALARTLTSLPADGGAIELNETSQTPLVDGRGRPSYLIAPSLLDLAAIRASRGEDRIRVINVLEPQLLAGLSGLAGRVGISITTSSTNETEGVITAVPRKAALTPSQPRDVAGPHIATALTDGVLVDERLWWDLYELSNGALTPDSALSRHHAGASIIDSTGQIIGELGEDEDYVLNQA